jgi:alpha-glucosidase
VALLKETISFWLDHGVDGFRIDSVGHFFESESMEDEPLKTGKTGDGYDDLDHIHTFNLAKNIELLAEFRQVLDNKTEEDPYNPRIMLTEAYLDLPGMIKYYGEGRHVEPVDDDLSDRSTISQMPLNFGLISEFKTKEDLTTDKLRTYFKTYLDGLPSWAWPNFQLGNHDNGRVASRFGPELVDAMNMVYMLLPGTPITYYGEELGMIDAKLESPVDHRDPERTPMQWSAEAQAGFTSGGQPWLPVNPDYTTLNADAQLKKDIGLNSHAAIYSYLANLRQNEAILFGSTEFINGTANGHELFGYVRVKKGNPGTLVVVNFGDTEVTADLTGLKFLPERGTVQVRSVHDPEAEVEKSILFNELKVKPNEGLVVAFVPQF